MRALAAAWPAELIAFSVTHDATGDVLPITKTRGVAEDRTQVTHVAPAADTAIRGDASLVSAAVRVAICFTFGLIVVVWRTWDTPPLVATSTVSMNPVRGLTIESGGSAALADRTNAMKRTRLAAARPFPRLVCTVVTGIPPTVENAAHLE